MSSDSELPMLSNDPRRPTFHCYLKGSLESRKKHYEARIKWMTEHIEKHKQDFAQSFTGNPENSPGTILSLIEYAQKEIRYLDQCVDAINKSAPRPRGVHRNAFWT